MDETGNHPDTILSPRLNGGVLPRPTRCRCSCSPTRTARSRRGGGATPTHAPRSFCVENREGTEQGGVRGNDRGGRGARRLALAGLPSADPGPGAEQLPAPDCGGGRRWALLLASASDPFILLLYGGFMEGCVRDRGTFLRWPAVGSRWLSTPRSRRSTPGSTRARQRRVVDTVWSEA
jgi:hypothetical protein